MIEKKLLEKKSKRWCYESHQGIHNKKFPCCRRLDLYKSRFKFLFLRMTDINGNNVVSFFLSLNLYNATKWSISSYHRRLPESTSKYENSHFLTYAVQTCILSIQLKSFAYSPQPSFSRSSFEMKRSAAEFIQ